MKNKSLKTCKEHGDLNEKDIKKEKLRSGNYTFKCKKCAQIKAHKHYVKNKEQVLSKQKEWRNSNKEKVKKLKAISYQQNKHKYIRNERLYDKKYKKRIVDELADDYIKQLICRDSGLRFKDIPSSLVKFKRQSLILKKNIKANKDKKVIDELKKRLSKINGCK